MQLFTCIKIIGSINVVIIVILFINQSSKTNSFLPLIINSVTSHSINISFRDKRINELLTSYSHVYEDTIYECNTTIPLTDNEKNAFDIIAIKMPTLRIEMMPYPNEYFHGRGIVLTTGRKQLKFARVNLKMIEITGTRLPVQVICLV
jgi:hypothetical protein